MSTADESDTKSRISSSDDDEDDDDESSHSLGAEAAGFVRGVARSLGRSLAKSPIGSLPKSIKPSASVFRQPIPVKQVAKLSDRISTGLSWYSAAEETSSAGVNKRNPLSPRVKALAFSIAKNTVLGTVVFETYCHMVVSLVSGKPLDDVDFTDDEYARATLPIHFGAGLSAGAVQGVGVSSPAVWEAIKNYRNTIGNQQLMTSPTQTLHTPSYAARFMSLNTLNHAMAHSVLFGSYEGTKRMLQHEFLDSSTPSFGLGYLFCIGMGGGIAGQIQHLFSHYSEQVFGISENTLMVAPSMIFRGFISPTLRATMMAFPSSAIGFIAFEYGKSFL